MIFTSDHVCRHPTEDKPYEFEWRRALKIFSLNLTTEFVKRSKIIKSFNSKSNLHEIKCNQFTIFGYCIGTTGCLFECGHSKNKQTDCFTDIFVMMKLLSNFSKCFAVVNGQEKNFIGRNHINGNAIISDMPKCVLTLTCKLIFRNKNNQKCNNEIVQYRALFTHGLQFMIENSCFFEFLYYDEFIFFFFFRSEKHTQKRKI